MMEFKVISKTEIKKVRSKDEMKYKYLLEKNNVKYYALFWTSLENPIVYDYEYDDIISKSNWYIMKNGYANNHTDYMHKVIVTLAKIQNYENDDLSVDHINYYKLDNRTKNLRMATQSQQNSNRASRCDKNDPCEELQKLGVNELPKHIRWDKTEKKFIIEKHPYLIKEVQLGLRKKACMSGSKSTKITIIQKYQDILARLEELNKLNSNSVDIEFNKIKSENTQEYEEISTCIRKYEGINIESDTESDNENIKIEPVKNTLPGRKTISKLPDNCGVDPEDIPKYCWYKPETDKRGDKFIIDRHPNLDKRYWSTTESITTTTLEKFNMMMEKYEELENMD